MTDYLRLAQERAPQSVEQEDNPYLPLARQQQELQQNRARTVIETALKDNPDVAAERLRLSQTSGLPPDVVRRNLEELRVKEQARAIDLVKMAQESPVLYRQLTDATFATTSIDDLDTLKNLERSVVKGLNYLDPRNKNSLSADVAGLTVDVGLAATAGVGEMLFNVAGTLNDLIGWQSGAEGARAQANRSREARQSFGFQPESSTGQAVKSGVQSAGTNLALLPLGLARATYSTSAQAGSVVAGAMAAGVGADAYLSGREQGLTQGEALRYAIPQAGYEYLFEKIPASKLFGDIAANTGLLKTLGKQAVSEGWTEQVTTLAQDFNEWMNLNPDKTLGQFIQERPEAAYQTFIATLVGVGVQTTTIKGINKIIERSSNEALVFEQDLLQQQMQLASQSALRARSPEQFRTHVQRVVDSDDGTKKEIYVDAEVLNQMPQELLAQLPESVREALPDALETRSTVAIPMADVLTVAPGTELEQILNDNARMRPNAASRVEAQMAAEFLAQDAQRVLEQAQDQTAWQQSAAAVQQTILDQLNATGRFTSDVNEAYALLQGNFFSSMAARLGITPQDLYDRYSLKVSAKQPGGAVLNDQFDQQGQLITDTPEFKNWFGESQVRDAEGKPLVVYHGTMTPGFSEFKRGEVQPIGGVRFGDAQGFYFTDDPGYASDYGTTVMPVYLSLKNPYMVPEGEYDHTYISAERRAELEVAGYDGVWAKGVDGGRFGEIVAFRPEQIKSVFNRGTFDPADANVLNQSVSTRLPTAKKALENPLEQMLVIGLDAAKADPKAFEKNVELIRQYPNFRDNKSANTPDKAAEQFIRHVVDNLLWLYDQVPAETRERSKLWYDGARAIVDRWVPKYGISDAQAAGMLAVLSPQKDWFQNVSLAERVLDVMATKQDFAWSDEMSQTAAGIGALSPEDVGEITGKTLGEIDSDYLQAIWVRVYDQAYNERGYRVVSPEGDFTDWVYNADGTTKSKTAWGSFNEIGKAISIYKDGSIANISASLGEQHKVRNFYNNIFNPASQHGDVTIDTHAVAAGLLRPLSGSATEVLHNFGAGGAASSSVFGSKGTYGIYAEAYRRAAAQRGVLPREMQSITWEAVRGLYTAGFKSQASNVAKIDAIWENYKKRRISLDDARNQLLEAASRINPPEWERPGAGSSETPWASSYSGELRQDGGPAGAAGRGDGGVSPDPAAGVLNQDARGTFSPEQLLVTLNENADLSTFLHESGHFFLEVMADLASQPNAPQQIQDDMAATLAWFGVPDLATWNGYTLEQKREYHEKWAESFEQYLFEGKAPNPELQPLFRRFRSWLINVYKSLQQFMRGRDLQLGDDIRQVFDRMIATDEQIAQAEEAAGMLPDFDATNEAIEKLQARSLRDLKWTVNARNKYIKKLQTEAKELRKGIEAEVRAEVDATPEMQAKAALDALRKSTPESKAALADWKAQRQAALDKAAEDIKAQLLATEGAGLEGLKKGQFLSKNKRRIANEAEAAALAWERNNPKPERTMTGTDLEIATVADSFGYASVDEMLQAIDAFGPKEAAIEGMTDQRMLERHGDLVDARAIEEAANEAVHNEARARSLATEFKAQSEMMSQRQDTGRTDARGRPITVNSITQAAKEFALNLASRRRIKDLKNAAWQHRSAEARAGKAWQAATAKGETEAAVQAKRDQVLNNAAAAALQDAQAEVKKALEFFKRVTKGSDEKTVERGRDPDVVNAMRAILAAYGVAPRLQKSALAYMETVAKNDPAMYAALNPAVNAAMLDAKPLKEMTVEELRGLTDTLRSMWNLAKRSRQMEVDGNLLDIEDAADELMARMDDIGIPDQVPGEKGAITDKEERGLKLQFAKSILRRVEQWAEGMDGKFGGPFLRLVFQPVKEAADRYRTARVDYRKRYTDMVKNLAPLMPPGAIDAPELGYKFGNARDSGTAELLHAILHTGNDSNKRKLLLGRGWASENADGTLDTSKWDAFIQRMISEGKLRKEHYDFAQGVWDLLEETKPLAQQAHRQVFGRYFAEVTANEFTTPFGTYRGGYVPAQTDSRLVKDAKLRELADGENESMAYAFPAAPSGFTKARVDYNKPLLLDLRTLGQHIDKVLLFSHMQPAITDVRRLLTDKRVSYALDRIDPGAYEGMLIPWLNRSAKQIVETPVVGDRKLSRFLSAARSRAGMALMFANLSNTAQQITGFSLAAVKVKPTLMLKAMAQFTAGPKDFKKSVADASPYMKDRMLNDMSAMNDAVEEILVDPSLLERGQAWTQRHAYFLQSAADNVMSPIIWTAAYNQAIGEGQNAKDAVRFADGVVRQTQGSLLPEDVSRFETGPAYARLFTQFVSYFNMMANTNATAVKQITEEMGLRKGAGKLLFVAMAGLLAPIWVAEAIAQAFRGGPEDDEGDGYLDDWLAAVFGFGTIKGLTAQVPIVGQGAQLVLSRFNDNPADDKFSLSPAVSLIESSVGAPSSVYKAVMEEGSAQKAVRDTAAAATLLTGLPIYAAARPIGYAAGMADDRIEPTGPVDLTRGLVTGTASPQSKQP